MNGVLVVDKPEGVTSFDVLNRVKRMVGAKKAGHTGILDAFAGGVLPVFLRKPQSSFLTSKTGAGHTKLW